MGFKGARVSRVRASSSLFAGRFLKGIIREPGLKKESGGTAIISLQASAPRHRTKRNVVNTFALGASGHGVWFFDLYLVLRARAGAHFSCVDYGCGLRNLMKMAGQDVG